MRSSKITATAADLEAVLSAARSPHSVGRECPCRKYREFLLAEAGKHSHGAILAAAKANTTFDFRVMVYGSYRETEAWRERYREILASHNAKWFAASRVYRFRDNGAAIMLKSSEDHLDGFDCDVLIMTGKPMGRDAKTQVIARKGVVLVEEVFT